MVLESQKVSGCLVAYLVSGNLLSKQLKHRWKTSPNKAFKGIHNAWRFQFKLSLVFKVQWFKFGGWRCSPLNAALCLIT